MTSPLDPGARGWHLMPRQWRASRVYAALRTAEARHVAELVLFDLPRFQDETHYFGGRAFTVHRGQLFASEETIAELAGTSRKVVRTVLRTASAAGLIVREKVHPSGQCPHLITVRDYELSQAIPDDRGPRAGQSGAEEGPETGLRKGPKVTEGTSGEPHEPQPAGGPAGDDEDLRGFRKKLAAALKVRAIGVGREPEDVLAFFREQLATHGEPRVLQDCIDAAEKSQTGTPGTLAWFVGWLEKLPAKGVARSLRPLRGPGENPRPGDEDFNVQDAWSDLEAFWARDAAGIDKAHCEFIGTTQDGRTIYGSEFPPKKRVTEPAAPREAFVGGRRLP